MILVRSSAGRALQVIEAGSSMARDWQYDLRRCGEVRLTKPVTENVPVAVTRLRFRFLASCMMARTEGPRNGVSDAHPRQLDQSGLFGHKSVSSIASSRWLQ
jgi:hypothetical protein